MHATGALPSPVEVARRLLELGRMFEDAEAELRACDEAWVEAKQEFEVAYSRALLTSSETSADRRKADAVLRTADLRLHMEIAEQLLRGVKERVKTLDRQMEIARSVGATARAEIGAIAWTPG